MFAAVQGVGQMPFLRPDDPLFVNLLKEQASATGMPVADMPQLPAGTEFITQDPYAYINIAADGSDKNDSSEVYWTGHQYLLMFAGAAIALLCLGILSAVMWRLSRSSSFAKVCSSRLCTMRIGIFVHPWYWPWPVVPIL